MPRIHVPPAPETIQRAREMYAQGRPVREILAATGLSVGTLYQHLDGGPLTGTRLPELPRRALRLGARVRPLKGDRYALAARLWRTAERQARDIELRLAQGGEDREERERNMRMLGLLVRTLRDLSVFDAVGAPRASAPAAAEPGAYEQRDVEEMRRDLARKIDAIIARRTPEEG